MPKRFPTLELWLPFILVLIVLTLGWLVALRFRQTVRDSVTEAFQKTQLEIVRAVSRSASEYTVDKLDHGESIADIEQNVFHRFVEPVRLLETGIAWIYAPSHLVFDLSTNLPPEYVNKTMRQIFDLNRDSGAAHYEYMTDEVSAGREGVSWYIWIPEEGEIIAAWTPVKVGDAEWMIGMSTPLSEIMQYTGAEQQESILLTAMLATTFGGLLLAGGSTRVQWRRLRAERLLARTNLELEARVMQRTSELAARTRELMEVKYREELQQKEAEAAYNAGLFESASSYLHNTGNSLAALEGRVLTMRRVVEATTQYPHAIEAIRQAHLTALDGEQPDKTPAFAGSSRRGADQEGATLLRESVDGVIEIKDQMIAAIRHQQDGFTESRNRRTKYVQSIKLAELLQTILNDFSPTLNKAGIRLETDLDSAISIMNQRQLLIHGLVNLLKNSIESIQESANADHGVIRISLSSYTRPYTTADRVVSDETMARRARIRIADNGKGILPTNISRLFTAGFTTKAQGHGLGLHSFALFLNENNGSIRAVSEGEQRGAEFIVEIGNI
ncbi:MAG: ATP-binding protein [Anaerolineae bacterium]